jgi:hypothetical protein
MAQYVFGAGRARLTRGAQCFDGAAGFGRGTTSRMSGFPWKPLMPARYNGVGRSFNSM